MARSKFRRYLNVAEKCSSVQTRHLAKSLHVHIANQQRVARTLKLAKNNTSTWKASFPCGNREAKRTVSVCLPQSLVETFH